MLRQSATGNSVPQRNNRSDYPITLTDRHDLTAAERLLSCDAHAMGVMRLTAAAHMGYWSNQDVMVLHRHSRGGASRITCHSAYQILSGADPMLHSATAEQQALLLAYSRFRLATTLRALWISTLEVYLLENPEGNLYLELGLRRRSSDYIDIRRTGSDLFADTRHDSESIACTAADDGSQTRFLEGLATMTTFQQLEGVPLYTVMPFYQKGKDTNELKADPDPRCLRMAFFQRYRAIQDRDMARISRQIVSHDASATFLSPEQIEQYHDGQSQSISSKSSSKVLQDYPSHNTVLHTQSTDKLHSAMERYLLRPTVSSNQTQGVRQMQQSRKIAQTRPGRGQTVARMRSGQMHQNLNTLERMRTPSQRGISQQDKRRPVKKSTRDGFTDHSFAQPNAFDRLA